MKHVDCLVVPATNDKDFTGIMVGLHRCIPGPTLQLRYNILSAPGDPSTNPSAERAMDNLLKEIRRVQRRLAFQRFLGVLGWCWFAALLAAAAVLGRAHGSIPWASSTGNGLPAFSRRG